uniref:ATP synthase subunit a n=1 Tax=Sooglossus sechellensis TaxID=356330 RepID=K9JZB9_SOOSE|nr:ATP synthase F0 subunit 6 [Sooglossus sechellensis]
MTLSLFNQFASPTLLGLPLVIIAIITPWLLIKTPNSQWLTNRFSSFLMWFHKLLTKQIFTPLSTKAYNWAALLTALMTFLISMNLFGLLPYTFTPTTQLSLNMGLAVPLWLATVTIGLRNQLTTSIGHLLPEGTPTPLIPILVVIETISLFIRPLALGVRLTANLTAGHLLIQLISMTTLYLSATQPILSMASFITLILLTMLEIAVAMIQAYVFTLLLSLYLQENT